MKAPVRRDSLCFCGLLSQSVASFPSSSVDPGNQLGCKPNLRHVVMYHCWLLLFYEQKLQAVYKVRKLHRRQNWRGNAPPTTFQLILFPTSMASGNKVLDTFSVTQCKTFSCLHHANIIMPSELHGPVPSYRNGQTLCIHMYVKVWAWDYFQMCYAIPGLCIQNVSSISIWGILAHLLILKLEACLPCCSLSQKPLCLQFPDYVLFWGTMCIELLHRQTTYAKTLRRRKIFELGRQRPGLYR